ncbi:MAG: hypothetical protein ACRC41_12960 [Sarcina sp.]
MIKYSKQDKLRIWGKTIVMALLIGFIYLSAFLMIIPAIKIEEGLIGFEVFLLGIIILGLIFFFRINKNFQSILIKEELKRMENMTYTISGQTLVIKKRSIMEIIPFEDIMNITLQNQYFIIITNSNEFIVPMNEIDDEVLSSFIDE